MATTREKFRARRAARFFLGRHWKPAQIRRMSQMESPPLVFNQIWLSREELEKIYPRPRAEFATD